MTIIKDALFILFVAELTILYPLWIDQELRAAPDNRTIVARVIISTWEGIRSGVEWVLVKAGEGIRSGVEWVLVKAGMVSK